MIRIIVPNAFYWPSIGVLAGLGLVFLIGLLMHLYVVEHLFAKTEKVLFPNNLATYDQVLVCLRLSYMIGSYTFLCQEVSSRYSKMFSDKQNHINGTERFWNQTKRHFTYFLR